MSGPVFDDVGTQTNPTHIQIGPYEVRHQKVKVVYNPSGLAEKTFVQGELLARDKNTGYLIPVTYGKVAAASKEALLESAVAEPNGGYASLQTGVEGSNNAILFTALEAGSAGEEVSIALIDPSGNNQALAVSIDGNAIKISLATSAEGAITSTAAQVISAVNEHLVAKELVHAANYGTSTGAAAVAAVAEAALDGVQDAIAGVFDNWATGLQIIPGTVTVYATVGAEVVTGSDDGEGNIAGDITGTVNYLTGAYELDAFTPDVDTDVEAVYAYSNVPVAIIEVAPDEVDTESTDQAVVWEAGLFNFNLLFVDTTDTMLEDLDSMVQEFYVEKLREVGIRVESVVDVEPA